MIDKMISSRCMHMYIYVIKIFCDDIVRKKCYVVFASREISVWSCYRVGIVSFAGTITYHDAHKSVNVFRTKMLIVLQFCAVPAVTSVKNAQYAGFLSRSAYLCMMSSLVLNF